MGATGIYDSFDVVRGFSPGGTAADAPRPSSNAPVETADSEGSDSIDGANDDVSDPDDDPGTGEEPEGAVILQKKTYRYTRSGDLMRIRDDLRGVIYDLHYR